MIRKERIKRVAIIAAAYYIEQEKADILKSNNTWARTGIKMRMIKHKIVQLRGRDI